MGMNSYEELRNQRLQENLKRFKDLGLQSVSLDLSEASKSETKTIQRTVKPRSKGSDEEFMILRRSSRASKNPVPVYHEVGTILPRYRMRFARKSSRGGDIRYASDEERIYAFKKAEKLQSNLKSGHPSFVKPMVRSHVSSCFWLGLPSKFCRGHLPRKDSTMILEDGDGLEFETNYIASREGLSGGWKGFAVDHKLDDGDALVFELIEPTKFKVYIIKVSEYNNEEKEKPTGSTKKTKCESRKKYNWTDNDNVYSFETEVTRETQSAQRAERAAKRRCATSLQKIIP
ncbi:hypothetical protein AMTRI_Chr08g168510 [Amborella trichopoda]|uniref:TF-B3 domain-containing protein n=1 Tax=Amborella trichopoda TaxID=13333 RepID=W1P328_AMBTC|nr:B3 domain-containing protein Os05g0481400 [Amborella trichopoda]ERN04247.1 hypothetical protein AMTR_s00077p00151100 [Amborella trichopoda]|eukprot:XP_006842572.1 B3 domain-containing protein Os05g0481400 [Amborella trichopoda]